jgi:hypothetical protein
MTRSCSGAGGAATGLIAGSWRCRSCSIEPVCWARGASGGLDKLLGIALLAADTMLVVRAKLG